ncbi:uncharacterized protein MYCFIDRAFT_174534 [Pseudocercospora fijiensis CIRAD86]|uniref:Uncharacterized protein n=1 Tax=Pseudocercospora fijiensis (strain CIRAD86) TaxID=383855 RepID=M3AEL2_PSEFD|nr:uncharacterized protein MYCFIDRAFT_174534 [Pseudocercospora fijiensis CIRAD86]EME83046.1 hypothetical protein MYCFIDRAFT_174534 [Pseudocercospora fijiensis CIRAD86]
MELRRCRYLIKFRMMFRYMYAQWQRRQVRSVRPGITAFKDQSNSTSKAASSK